MQIISLISKQYFIYYLWGDLDLGLGEGRVIIFFLTSGLILSFVGVNSLLRFSWKETNLYSKATLCKQMREKNN